MLDTCMQLDHSLGVTIYRREARMISTQQHSCISADGQCSLTQPTQMKSLIRLDTQCCWNLDLCLQCYLYMHALNTSQEFWPKRNGQLAGWLLQILYNTSTVLVLSILRRSRHKSIELIIIVLRCSLLRRGFKMGGGVKVYQYYLKRPRFGAKACSCFLDRLDLRYTSPRMHWFAEPLLMLVILLMSPCNGGPALANLIQPFIWTWSSLCITSGFCNALRWSTPTG